MSRFARAAHTSHSLSLAAMEEASRTGLRTADIEHLLLALVINDQSAGRVLRDAGLEIEAARRAVDEQRAAQLAGLGIEASFPNAGPIVFHETDGYEWSTRANDVITRASGKGRAGDAGAVLRELLIEPSGSIDGILTRLGTSAGALRGKLDVMESSGEEAPLAVVKVRGRAAGSMETFIPAPIAEVWAFLVDPSRIPEWNLSVGSIDVSQPDPEGRDVWDGLAPTEHPDGKPVQRKPRLRRRRITLVSARRPDGVTWSFAYPDAPGNSPVSTEFTLVGTTGGTQLRTTMSWARRRGWRKLVALPLRPLQEFMLWIMLSQTGNAVSRAFR